MKITYFEREHVKHSQPVFKKIVSDFKSYYKNKP